MALERICGILCAVHLVSNQGPINRRLYREDIVMKRLFRLCLLLMLVFALDGCSVIIPTTLPFQGETPPIFTILPSLTPRTPATVTPIPTRTPVNTLEPKEATEAIRRLLQEPVDCSAPCFWGIVPGQTTLDEANSIFSHLGLQMATSTLKGNMFSGIHFTFDSGLSFRATLAYQDMVVKNIQIKITPEKQEVGAEREWTAYSLDTLIERYGRPSRVDFMADWGPGPFFSMQIYFDGVDMIVQYAGDNIIPAEKGRSQICPLTTQFESVWIWMGKDPLYPPREGMPLEMATSLTLDEFTSLMENDPKAGCFIFNGDIFP